MYCNSCDTLCVERFYKNHLKRLQVENIFLFQVNMEQFCEICDKSMRTNLSNENYLLSRAKIQNRKFRCYFNTSAT